MRHTLYECNGKLFATQKALSHYHSINPNTFRSRIERSGGLDNTKEVTINGLTIKFHTEYL